MCGIVGMLSRKPAGFFHSDMDIMEGMLLLDTLRGEDSTGVFTVAKDNSVAITKIGSHPLHLFASNGWGKYRQKVINNGRVCIGHNRKATAGAINSQNAHPFHENNIVLVHNGTVRGSHKAMADTEVDSHAICHAFNDKGAEAVLKTLDAAFAFVWYDLSDQKVRAIRNTERPLALVTTEELHILCSEPWMAHAMLGRANKKVLHTEILKPGVMFEFDERGGYTTKEVELRKEPVYTTYATNYAGTGNRHWRDMADACADPDDDLPTTGVSLIKDTPFHNAAQQLVSQCGTSDRNLEYKQGDKILIQVTGCESSPSGMKAKLTGKTAEPGKTMVDIVGYSDVVSREALQAMVGEYYMAEITGFARSVCGPSLWITNMEPAEQVETFTGYVPKIIWDHIVAHEHCHTCKASPASYEAQFTGVKVRLDGAYRIRCADCVEDSLKGDLQNDFTKRRLDALQDGEPVSQEPPNRSLQLVAVDGKTTLH